MRIRVGGIELDRPAKELGSGRGRLGRAALSDEPTEIRQRFGVVGFEFAHLLVANDRLLRVHAEELAGLGKFPGNLVAGQPAGDRLSGQALPRGSSDEPTGQ